MSDEHWIRKDSVRRRFWPWAKEVGADHDEVHVALGGVESVADFAGTMEEAKLLILAYVKGKAAGMSRTYDEMTEEARAEAARLEGAVKGMPEAPVLAWTKFQSREGFEWTVSLRSGLQPDLALLALEQLRERVTLFEELARVKDWAPLADSRNGIGARIGKVYEKPLAPTLDGTPHPPASTTPSAPMTQAPTGNGGEGETETYLVQSIKAQVTPNGNPYYAVKGGRCTKRGVTAWPEVAEPQIQAIAQFDLTTLEVGQEWTPPFQIQAVSIVPEGREWPNKVTAFAPAP